MEKKYALSAVSFGEVLFDLFPTHKKIGGAPLNVAQRMKSLGVQSKIISKVGLDEEGREIIEYLQSKEMDVSFIQKSKEYKTGVVHVMINEKGNASYDIAYPSAWDKIEHDEQLLSVVSNSDVFIFGSLICRDEVSRNSLFTIINHSNYSVFDVNLRQPYYTKENLVDLMKASDFIKLNDEELLELSQMLESPFNSFEQNIRFIASQMGTSHICVTKGAFGAVLFYNDKFYYNSGYFIKVADTVGAGDSFLASLVTKLLRGDS
uniref:PfkB family carbohydrate kinase n=1 Tax=Flavobacterium sp. TaxID=239 RepID=UPI00286F1742